MHNDRFLQDPPQNWPISCLGQISNNVFFKQIFFILLIFIFLYFIFHIFLFSFYSHFLIFIIFTFFYFHFFHINQNFKTPIWYSVSKSLKLDASPLHSHIYKSHGTRTQLLSIFQHTIYLPPRLQQCVAYIKTLKDEVWIILDYQNTLDITLTFY
jgi:hypothetical protein